MKNKNAFGAVALEALSGYAIHYTSQFCKQGKGRGQL